MFRKIYDWLKTGLKGLKKADGWVKALFGRVRAPSEEQHTLLAPSTTSVIAAATASSSSAAITASSTTAMAALGSVVPAASLSAVPAPSSSSPMVPDDARTEKNPAMLTREQVYLMVMLRNRGNNVFSVLPNELICHISDVGENPHSEINTALRLAADGEEQALKKLTVMLDRNPRLLLQAGNVMTRGELYVKRVTLYEFFLGAGDPDAAARIAPYFDRIEGGAGQRDRQYARYQSHIGAMLMQTPYDLKPLLDIIKSSSSADVTALLNHDMTHESSLRDAIIQFRADQTPGVLVKPRMHYNYKTLQSAFDLLCDEWDALSNHNTNHDKCDLVAICVFGYLQRSLPSIDRIAFARNSRDRRRTLEFVYASGRFPDSSTDLSLGISNWIWANGMTDREPATRGCWRQYFEAFLKFTSDRSNRLTKLMQPESAGCLIC